MEPLKTAATARDKRLALILHAVFKRSNDVMFFCDKEGRIQDINEAFTRHYGWTRDEAIGKTPALLRSSRTTPELYKRMWSSILDPKQGFWRGQITNKTKDGREIPLILTITAVRDEAGEVVGYVSNAFDLTDQVALQARLAQSEALATLGEMAAVMAHEIRNPLSSVVMAAQQLAGGGLGAQDKAMVLQVLRSESARLNEALTNLLSFARPRELRLERADLNEVASGVCRMLKTNADLLGSVRLTVALDKTLKPFPLDADQLRQVLWNLVLNAVQAMEGGGTLKVSTSQAAGAALLRVEDTGPGLSEAALKGLFKPFSTTKAKGTGLGLAVADRIAKAHAGRIEVQSRPGKGAVFTVSLPRAKD